jgi:uncharacterized protein (DUF885 family)
MMTLRPFLLTGAMLLAGCVSTQSTKDNPAPVSPTPMPASTAAEPAAAAAPAENADAALAAFFERYDAMQLARSPLSKAYRGIIDADYGKWDDLSDAAAQREYQEDQAMLAEMRERFANAELSEDSRLSYRLFEAMMERRAKAFPFRLNDYVFDQMNGLQSRLPAFLINIHRVTSKSDAEAYVSRLDSIDEVMATAIDEAKLREQRGVLPPKWVYPYIISDAQNLLKGAPFDDGPPSTLLADFTQKVSALDLPQPEKDALVEKAKTALLNSVKPAYEQLIAFFKEQEPRAGTEDGVWRFADGEAYYDERLGYYTTTDLSADEVHQLGLQQVERIHGEMREIMKKVGFKGTLNEFFQHVRSDPSFYYDTREAYLADVDKRVAAMEAKLPEYFGRLPKAHLRIKAVEPFREKSAGKAFYQGPSPDGSRPGTYYVNLYKLRDMSKNELEALVYHEGIPGHHLQRTIQTELTGVPPFRRFGSFTAYTEGWGLYAEELGKDMGFYTDPYSDFGRLGMELWRAARLVVDTGIHSKHWSREQAIDWLKQNTPNPEGDIRKAIERYIVYPGQATAYMIGKLKIMELRQRAMDRLGDRFDWGEFHDAVLLPGPVPLDVLEENIDAWLESKA